MATVIDWTKETEAAKLKMIEFGLAIPFKMGMQMKDMSYGELRRMSNKFIVDNMRRFKDAFGEFVDPEVPELEEYQGGLTRKEVYFVLRSILMEQKREVTRVEAAKIRQQLDGMKTRREIRSELEAKLAKLENTTVETPAVEATK